MQSLNTLFETRQANSHSDLNARYEALIQAQPKLRRRNAADLLAVAEAQLLEAQCGLSSLRLDNRFAEMIYDFPQLGYLMTLTRNDSAVHERKGIYDNVSINGPMGLVITQDRKIDLRIIISRWHAGFAVLEQTPKGPRYSLQFFDNTGDAIQKIYLQPESDLQAYQTLLEKHLTVKPDTLVLAAQHDEQTYLTDAEVDSVSLKRDWRDMRNVHQFFGLLKKHQVSRLQAFRLVGEPLAQRFDASRLEGLLDDIAKSDLSIMCFVGNRGNIQIHTGPINIVRSMGPWLNILDDEFNLHLLTSNIDSAWLVRKPSADGDITSLELYDGAGETIAQFFGQREEGNPENTTWRHFAERLLEAETNLEVEA
ncbi:hemin transport protein HmuS [Marinomonas sp. MED121]|uniref:hemin-degrading factor n=1 Tax=Marinomonas sp. MED121 TaxID=314277 RepID=UPI000068FAC4|nr:hemin-degrading factor [Marinomonas sp. MED121]EAQ63913.1 hemin transport protein HmuS [Marinomonas sp. MED121]